MQVARQGTGQGGLLVAYGVADDVALEGADEVVCLVPRDVAWRLTREATGQAMGEAWEGVEREGRIED